MGNCMIVRKQGAKKLLTKTFEYTYTTQEVWSFNRTYDTGLNIMGIKESKISATSSGRATNGAYCTFEGSKLIFQGSTTTSAACGWKLMATVIYTE